VGRRQNHSEIAAENPKKQLLMEISFQDSDFTFELLKTSGFLQLLHVECWEVKKKSIFGGGLKVFLYPLFISVGAHYRRAT
jgi:hypothetical protein